MKFLEELKPMKLYPSKYKIFIPINVKDKKHKSAILLFTKSQEDSERLMNLPYFYNPKYFLAYYMSRDVDAYIKDNLIVPEDEELEPQTEALLQKEGPPEGLKIKYGDSCTMYDVRDIRIIVRDKAKLYLAFLELHNASFFAKVTFEVYDSFKDIKNKFHIGWDSYSDADSIHIVRRSCYMTYARQNGQGDDGTYEEYVLNELATFLINKKNPEISPDIASWVAGYLSGQYANTNISTDDTNIAGARAVANIVSVYGKKPIIEMIKKNDPKCILGYGAHSTVTYLLKGMKVVPKKESAIIKTSEEEIEEEVYKAPIYDKYNIEKEEYIMNDDYAIIHLENGDMIHFFDKEDEVLNEAQDKAIYKKFLYKERIKKDKDVLDLYSEVKRRNPWITKTFKKLELYKGLNIFVDLNYYHGLYLKNNIYKLKKGMDLYWNMIQKFFYNSKINSIYTKQTILIPVEGWGTNDVEVLTDYTKSLNPISVLCRLAKVNPKELQKEWGNKVILFVANNGYFRVDFSNFDRTNLFKFKKFLTKLLTNKEIVIDPGEEDDIESSEEVESPKSLTANILNNIEDKTNIQMNTLSSSIEDSGDSTAHINIVDSAINHMKLFINKSFTIPNKIVTNIYLISPTKEDSIKSLAATTVLFNKKDISNIKIL